MKQKEMEFTVFMIHVLAEAWNLSCGEVYQKLNVSGAIDEYMVPFYDVLHTLGDKYLTEDIREYLEMRGVHV